MSGTLLLSTIFITAALIFYTLGVWAERIARYLKHWHLAAFWVGLVCDMAGTYGMERLGEGIDWASWHTITGVAAIALMLIHASWASVVVARNDERARVVFHRYSLVVWLFWLVPYFGGMILGVT